MSSTNGAGKGIGSLVRMASRKSSESLRSIKSTASRRSSKSNARQVSRWRPTHQRERMQSDDCMRNYSAPLGSIC
jgi:hypothetical protein